MPPTALYKFVDADTHVSIYPLGDFHLGSPQCDESFVKKSIRRVADDPNGYAVLMGDLTENNVLTGAGSVFEQIYTPVQQKKKMIDMLSPIKDKILFGVESNHSIRTFKLTGQSVDRDICDSLGVKYAGHSCYYHLSVYNQSRNKSYRYKIYAVHSRGGGRSKGSKREVGQKVKEITPTADAIFYAHTHDVSYTAERFYDWVINAGHPRLVERYRYIYNTGSSLDWGGYAEEKSLPPAVKSFIKVDFMSPKRHGSHKDQNFHVLKP